MPRFLKVFVLALFAAEVLMLGGCSKLGGSGPAAPVSPVSPILLRDSYDSTALFGYHYPVEDGQANYFFTQSITGGGFGDELSTGSWQGIYESMTSFEVGGYYYIMGQHTNGYWFIQQILPSGDLGPQTDSGTWGNYYQTLVGFQEGGETYIFGQRTSDNGWFTQQILPGGKMGNQVNASTWHYFYDTLVPLQVGGETYLFGQTSSHAHPWSGYSWFLQQITDGGYMGPQTDGGTWKWQYQTVVPLQVGGETYIFGQTTDSFGYWFLQQINNGGHMGDQTDTGTWGHVFGSMTSFQSGGNTYIFGQSSKDNSWFIQQITSGGWMGKNETASGNWGNYYNNVFAFTFSSKYQDVHNWMTQNWSILNDKTLGQIIIPGSHDSGMSLTQNCYMASDCNTKTQLYSIAGQLNNGSRYFDVRPVRDWGGGPFYAGHFSLNGGLAYGCEGELLQDILNEVRTFVQDNPGEIVTLKFSHCYELSHLVGETKDDCAPDGTTALYVALVRATLGDIMYKCTGANCLAKATLGDIRASDANVVALFGDNAASDPANGVFTFDGDFSVHDDYSNTDDLSTMENDQVSQLMNLSNHTSNDMYLTSWTLTMNFTDASNCSSGATKSIIEMSQAAKATLIPEIWGMTISGEITTSLLPNILYVDANDQFSARLAIMMNNYFYIDNVDVPAGDFMMGCNSAVDTECNSDEKPYHKVTLSDFAIDKNLVTAVEYKQCVASGACTAPAPGDTCTYGVAGKEVFPVNCVTWNQASAYCQWRGKHLPTEAQWEKAARGTDGRKYPWGNSSLDCSHAVMRANGCSSPNLTRIGSKPAGASPYGALDMAGNVWEWVADWYGAGYYSTSPATDPQGPSTGTQKSTRGGSYDTTLTSRMRTSNRSNSNPASTFDNVGFRCAK